MIGSPFLSCGFSDQPQKRNGFGWEAEEKANEAVAVAEVEVRDDDVFEWKVHAWYGFGEELERKRVHRPRGERCRRVTDDAYVEATPCACRV